MMGLCLQWTLSTCHNMPERGRNQPDAVDIGQILAPFWHISVLTWNLIFSLYFCIEQSSDNNAMQVSMSIVMN